MRHTQTTRPATIQASFTQTLAPEKVECGTTAPVATVPRLVTTFEDPDLCMEVMKQDKESVEDIDDDDSDDADFELRQSARRKRATRVTSTTDVLPVDDQTYLIFGAQLVELFKSISPTLDLEVSSK
jgi:hypothetical protein